MPPLEILQMKKYITIIAAAALLLTAALRKIPLPRRRIRRFLQAW